MSEVQRLINRVTRRNTKQGVGLFNRNPEKQQQQQTTKEANRFSKSFANFLLRRRLIFEIVQICVVKMIAVVVVVFCTLGNIESVYFNSILKQSFSISFLSLSLFFLSQRNEDYSKQNPKFLLLFFQFHHFSISSQILSLFLYTEHKQYRGEEKREISFEYETL